tara:strand:+ start:1191 stop:1700 length:510 start_codon:yes stop_codon:yes gene_type:complete
MSNEHTHSRFTDTKTSFENEILLKGIEERQTSLQQMSKYLSELESQLALIFSASPDIIVFLDSEAKILKISDAVTTILGYTRADMIGNSLWDFFCSEEDIKKIKKHFDELQDKKIIYPTKKASLVSPWKAKDGSSVRLVWRFAVCDEREHQTIGIASDISYFEEYSSLI